MNKWISITVAIILTAGIVVNGVLYFQANSDLADAQSRISVLEGNYDTLEGDMALLDDSFSVLEGNFSSLDDNVSSLEGNVSSLEGNVSSLEGNVSSLEGNVSSLEGDISLLGDSIYSLTNKVSGVEDNVSSIGGEVSSLVGDVSTMQDDISSLEAHDRAVMDVVAMVSPSIVRIVADLGDGWYGEGTGVIITDDGWVLTNQHVVEGAQSIEITLMSGETLDAEDDFYTHGTLDIAILKIDSSRTDFPVATLGSSADITVGEQVVAIGFPFWPEISDQPTVTTGIVSAVRTFADDEWTEMFGAGLTDLYGNGLWIQTDAAINHGNSGGPLINLKGEVIGINTLGFKFWDDTLWESINFSVPIDETMPFPEEVTG